PGPAPLASNRERFPHFGTAPSSYPRFDRGRDAPHPVPAPHVRAPPRTARSRTSNRFAPAARSAHRWTRGRPPRPAPRSAPVLGSGARTTSGSFDRRPAHRPGRCVSPLMTQEGDPMEGPDTHTATATIETPLGTRTVRF